MVATKLQSAHAFVSMLSPYSVERPWVMFEAGAAEARGKDPLVICIKGLTKEYVQQPLSDNEIREIASEEDVRDLILRVANIIQVSPDRLQLEPHSSLATKVVSVLMEPDNERPPSLSRAAKAQEHVWIHEYQQKIADLSGSRRVFWETLNDVFSQSPPVSGISLNDFIDGAPPPLGLPLTGDEMLLDYKKNYVPHLDQAQRSIFSFCVDVYPAKVPDKKLEEISKIAPSEFSSFHNARREHSNMWNELAARIYSLKVVSLDSVAKRFENHRRMVNLLSYLEIALVFWTQDKGKGKQWLFTLNRDWHKLAP